MIGKKSLRQEDWINTMYNLKELILDIQMTGRQANDIAQFLQDLTELFERANEDSTD